MAIIPYQPTYAVNPKYGFRYLSQPYVPNVTSPSQPLQGLDGSLAAAPAVLGTQQGTYGGDNTPPTIDKVPAAQASGYQQGRQDIAGGLGTMLGAATGIPFLGTIAGAAAQKLDQSGKPPVGSFGTYDVEGNVYGQDMTTGEMSGKRYDPITGEKAGYSSPSNYFSDVYGYGTEDGLFGESSSYGKLREAGYDPVQSILGSYEASTAYIPRSDRMSGISPASKQGVLTTMGKVRSNTLAAKGMDDSLLLGDQPEVGGGYKITPETIGFSPNTPGYELALNSSGQFGMDPGDIAKTASGQTGVINDQGAIVTPTGTVVQGDIVDAAGIKTGGTWTSKGLGGAGFNTEVEIYQPAPTTTSSSSSSGGGSSGGGSGGWQDSSYANDPGWTGSDSSDDSSGGGGWSSSPSSGDDWSAHISEGAKIEPKQKPEGVSMHLKSFKQKDRYGNEMAVEFYDVPPMQTPEYDHPGEPKGPDTVPAWLTPGEFVVNAEAVRMFEPEIEAMNEAGRAVQREQGGTIPEYKAEGGGIIQGITDYFTMPKAPPGIEYRRMPDGSIGQFTKKTGTGGGQTYLGKLEGSRPTKQNRDTFDFSSLYNAEGGPIYAEEGTLADFLKAEEGIRNEAYLDSAGVPTIGYGSTYGVKMGDKVSDAEANQKLMQDIAVAEEDYDKLVNVDLNPNQQKAVKSLLFNIGGPQFEVSKARAALNAGDFDTFQKEASEFRMADGEVLPGLEARRAREMDLFRTPYETADADTGSGFSFIKGAEASTLVPAVDQEPPKPEDDSNFFQKYILGPKGKEFFDSYSNINREGLNAEFNRKITEGNADSVANSFETMEAKRLDNLEKGKEEFDGINEFTYNKSKEAVEFQKQKLIEATQNSLDLNQVDPGRADAAMDTVSRQVSELGVPSPEDLAIYQSDGYQSMLGRQGAEPLSIDEYKEIHTEDESGVAPVERITGTLDADPTSEIESNIQSVSEITKTERPSQTAEVITGDTAVDNALGNVFNYGSLEADPDKDGVDEDDVGNTGQNKLKEDPTMAENIMGFFEDAFSDLFDGKELARMAIMYAGSRAMGYTHSGSLSYSMKNYIKRVDANVAAREKFINSEKAIEAYTESSLQEYRKTGDRSKLIPKEKEVVAEGLGDNIYHEQFGVLPTVKIGDGKNAIEYGGQYYSFNDPLMVGKVHKYDKDLHDPVTYMEFFNDRADSYSTKASQRYKQGKENVDMSSIDNSLVADDAAQIFQEQVLLFGATPAAQNKIRGQVSRAVDDYYDAVAKALASGKTPPASMHQFYNKRAISQRTAGQVSYEMIKDVDAETFALLDRSLLQNAMAAGPDAAKNAKVYLNAWETFESTWKRNSKGSPFEKIMGKDDKHNNFTYWIQSLLDPTSYMHKEAKALLNKKE